ncbi:hypothetical protein GCM10023096_60780 [Nonomuraea ferruginea]
MRAVRRPAPGQVDRPGHRDERPAEPVVQAAAQPATLLFPGGHVELLGALQLAGRPQGVGEAGGVRHERGQRPVPARPGQAPGTDEQPSDPFAVPHQRHLAGLGADPPALHGGFAVRHLHRDPSDGQRVTRHRHHRGQRLLRGAVPQTPVQPIGQFPDRHPGEDRQPGQALAQRQAERAREEHRRQVVSGDQAADADVEGAGDGRGRQPVRHTRVEIGLPTPPRHSASGMRSTRSAIQP